MDMWNWLHDCYKEGSLSIEDLERVLFDDAAAKIFWEEWSIDSRDFIEYVRNEVYPFLQYVKKREAKACKA